MRDISWEIVMNPEELPDPAPVPTCPIGVEGHRWVLSFEFGPVLHLEEGEVCPKANPTDTFTVCENAVLYDGFEGLVMAPLPVRVAFGADHENLGGWHGDVRCDCNWWWEMEPMAATK